MCASFDPSIDEILGDANSSLEEVEERARRRLGSNRFIVWEGDAQTFQFGYVGGDAEELLGHSSADWLTEEFWTNHVIHPEDRNDAVAYCALATVKAKDHAFKYRARTTSGEVIWLEDFVRVLLSPRGIPERLRGLMIELEADEVSRSPRYRPGLATLEALP